MSSQVLQSQAICVFNTGKHLSLVVSGRHLSAWDPGLSTLPSYEGRVPALLYQQRKLLGILRSTGHRDEMAVIHLLIVTTPHYALSVLSKHLSVFP